MWREDSLADLWTDCWHFKRLKVVNTGVPGCLPVGEQGSSEKERADCTHAIARTRPSCEPEWGKSEF